jgi:hypothetical protein
MRRAFSCPGLGHRCAHAVAQRNPRALLPQHRPTNTRRRAVFPACREKHPAVRAKHSARRAFFSNARAFCSTARAGELDPPGFLLGPPGKFLGPRSYFPGGCSYFPGPPSSCTRRTEQKARRTGLFSRQARVGPWRTRCGDIWGDAEAPKPMAVTSWMPADTRCAQEKGVRDNFGPPKASSNCP